ncbi:MAG TPA: OmpA family protein, partial [Acidimicrobiales bacterium]|nr:OmpA family protein [Acidimicrobiales bacterium]
PAPTPSTSTARSLATLAQQISQALAAHGLGAVATVTLSASSVVVQVLADKAFFDTDSADLGAKGAALVDAVSGVLRDTPNPIAVDGYTDNQPILGGPYTSNWELSAARAATVVNRMATVDGVDDARLSAIGYGETHPLVPNSSPANQAMNRRIDFVVLSPESTAP